MVKQRSAPAKYYVADIALRNAVLLPDSEDAGKALENIVYLNLERLNDDNVEREIGGLIAASSVTGCKQGKIITFSQREAFERDGIRIEVMPIWEME